MNRVALAIGVLLATNAFAADADYCFAFMRGGDVVVSCEGQEFKVGQVGGRYSFAISEEQGVLAVVWGFAHSTVNGGPDQGSVDLVTRLDLKTIKALKPLGRQAVPTLMSTCGSLFGVFDEKRQPTRRDLMTDTDISVDPYVWFRCSSDRKVIAGIRESDRALYVGAPEGRQIAPAGSAAHYEFNISPNGKYVAYASDRQPLCVWSAEGTSCAASSAIDTTHELVSVRDDGEVLVSMGIPEKCVYKSNMDFSPAKPGAKNTFNCIGIAHWHVGMVAPEIVEPLGREPQWISPATAELLRAWARKSKAYF